MLRQELYANAVNAAPRRRGGRRPVFEEDVELRRAKGLIERGRTTEAASILEYLAEQTAEPTKLVRMWRYLGDARLALGHQEEAFDAYRRGISVADDSQLQSDGTELRNLLAGHLSRLDCFAEALLVVESGLRRSPTDKELWKRHGIVHWYAGDFAEAYASLTTAERYGLERNHVCHARGGVLAEWGLYHEAVEELTYAIDHAASRLAAAYARNGRAYALARLGDSSRAETDWAASHDVAPENAWLRYLRGRIAEDTGDSETARRDYELALSQESPRLVGPRRGFVEERLRELRPA